MEAAVAENDVVDSFDRTELHAEILDFLVARVSWESKQRVWYQKRHDGLGRKAPPWPGAADLHFPLSDTQIGQFKPFYYQQVFGNEIVATFIPRNKADTELARIAEQWFNFQMCYKSNLPREHQIFTDQMLQSGQTVCKVIYDHSKGQVMFDAVDPLSIIVPPYTRNIQDCDKLVHVIKYSVDAYKRQPGYRKDKEFVDSIIGDSWSQSKNDQMALDQLKQLKEGFAVSCSDRQIIVWEVYVKVQDTDEYGNLLWNDEEETEPKYRWDILTYSPTRPDEDIKEPYPLPYDHGQLPFVQFEFEIKEKSFFSSRGIVEMVAMEETYLDKLWNEKSDSMTLCNRPVCSITGTPIPNMENLRLNPGSVIGTKIEPVIFPKPIIDFDEEMNNTRSIAERRVGTPDYGIQNNQPVLQSRTATEVNKISQLSANSTNLRSATFRMSLTALYQQAWALLLQYKKDDFQYYYQEEMMEANPIALKDIYFILPSGAIDSYNKDLQMQKAQAMFQTLWGNPYIRQDQLVRNYLTQVDPRYVVQLFSNPAEANQSQAEAQNLQNMEMENGMQAQAKNIDDQVVRMQVIIARLTQLAQEGVRLNPKTVSLYIQHFNDRLFMFKAQKGKQAPEADQFEKAFKQALLPFMPPPPPQVMATHAARNGNRNGISQPVTAAPMPQMAGAQ